MTKDTVYIAISGAEIEYPSARDSIQLIVTRPGDSSLNFVRSTKGYESRQLHINNFLQTKHDYILFLDADQVFPQNTLERLRSHGLPLVSGFYTRRRYDVIAPVWYEPFTGKLPLTIWHKPLEPDKLYEIGASGWGCLLVHRDVIVSVKEFCKGEWVVLEDDMDVLPYDLAKIMAAIRGLRALEYIPSWEIERKLNEFERHLHTLETEIVPFGCSKEPVGSDIRFGVFAKMVGYQMHGDTGVNARHIVDYPLGLGDYARYVAANGDVLSERVMKSVSDEATQYAAAREAVMRNG